MRMAIQRNEALHQRIHGLTDSEFLAIIADNEKLAELGIYYKEDVKRGEDIPAVNRTINTIRATLDSIPVSSKGSRPVSELIRQYKYQLFAIAEGRTIITEDTPTPEQTEADQKIIADYEALDFILQPQPLRTTIAVNQDLSAVKVRAYILKIVENINAKGVPLADRNNIEILPILQKFDITIDNIEMGTIELPERPKVLSAIFEEILLVNEVFSQQNKSNFINMLLKMELAHLVSAKLYPLIEDDRLSLGVVLEYLNKIYGSSKTYINSHLRTLKDTPPGQGEEEAHLIKTEQMIKASKKLEQLVTTLRKYTNKIDSPAARVIESIVEQIPPQEKDDPSFYEKYKKYWDAMIIVAIILEILAAYYLTPLPQMLYDLNPELWESILDQFINNDASVDTLVAVMTAPRFAKLSVKIEELCIADTTN